MKDLRSTCKIAVVQAEPILFDKDACVEKTIEMIGKAADNQAELIVFPELFIPGYPYGMTFGFTVGSRKDAERVVWGDADRGFFPVIETPWGVMGDLICWESYMPLARAALYEKGVTLYISSNTNDNPEWQATIQHIALEGRCYLINCDMFFTKESYPENLHCKEEIDKLPHIVCRGGSCIVDPYGHYETRPVWDKEQIIYADLNMEKVSMSRMEFDVCGHYARPDVLRLHVREEDH